VIGFAEEQELEHPLFRGNEIRVWMKRDDLIHPFISGNKWRKLQPILEIAREKEVRELVSYGGAYSNHLVALACLGAQYRLATKGIVRGEDVKNHVLQLCQLWGMQLEFVSREAFRDLRKESQLRIDDSSLIIPEGASCAEGIRGAATFWNELSNSYDCICDTVGSGSTMKGLLSGRPEGIDIEAYMCVRDEGLMQELQRQGARVVYNKEQAGFGKVSDEVLEAARVFSSQTGILLDPIYTGKMWYLFLERIKQGVYSKGTKVLVVHSGGLTGWLSDRMLKRI